MHVVAQGVAGAGKTIALQSLEGQIENSLYIPELVLPLPPDPGDDYFFANDMAKEQRAKTADIALMDRDGLSTIAWIAARDGANSVKYKDALAAYRAGVDDATITTPDVYLRFVVPFAVSLERQSPANNPLWKDERFVEFYERNLEELIAKLIPNNNVARVDGLMSKQQVVQACVHSILSPEVPDNRPDLYDQPLIDYTPRSFVKEKEYDILRKYPVTCIVLKPDCVRRGLVKPVMDILTTNGLRIFAQRSKGLSEVDIKQLWPTFWTEEWWRETCDYMESGPSIALLCSLERPDLVDYNGLTTVKSLTRKQFKDPAENRKVVSLLHVANSYEETATNVLAFWSQKEVHEILDKAND